MRLRTVSAICLAAAVAAGGIIVAAQSLPTTQPKLIQIYRERIKAGQAAAHEANEAGWPAAFAQAKSPDYYLAMESMTGRDEVWFVAPYDSYTALGKSMARDEANGELSAVLGRLSAADAQYLDGLDVIEATSVPELSHGTFPDLNQQRFWEITLFQVRPGYGRQFGEAVMAYQKAVDRAGVNSNWRVYRVTAGLPSGAYILFSSAKSFGDFDAMMAADDATGKAATPDELAMFEKFFAEGVASILSNKYRLSPTMSYVSPETKATDPAFWNKK